MGGATPEWRNLAPRFLSLLIGKLEAAAQDLDKAKSQTNCGVAGRNGGTR